MLLTIPSFLSADEVAKITTQLNQAQFNDGGDSAFGIAKKVKDNSQASLDDPNGLQLSNYLLSKLGNHPQFVSCALPQRIFPPRFNRYRHGQQYGYHVDAAIMAIPGTQDVMRSDVSMTVFLNNPDEYEGGELSIQSAYGRQQVKLNAGDAVVYPSASLHSVTQVTRGERLAAITWVQSMVPDAHIREQLYHLDQSIQNLQATDGNHDQLNQLSNVYHNLIRHFAQI